VIFFENIDDNDRPWFASPTPLAVVEFGRFEILADVLRRITDYTAAGLHELVSNWRKPVRIVRLTSMEQKHPRAEQAITLR
jgi:hypothetical protein